MKSIVLHEVVDKVYFLARTDMLYSGDINYSPISVDSYYRGAGTVGFSYNNHEWEQILETDGFERELNIKEYIHIDGSDYKISNVSHSADGAIRYYINKRLVNKDSESEIQAKYDLKERKRILAEREEIKRKELEKELVLEFQQKKKWYDFLNK